MSDFMTAVAERAGKPVEDVSTILEEYGVRAWVATPRSPQLLITKMTMSGTKPTGEAFAFEWELGPGVRALSSVDNDVGKTTVLAVIRWLLSGRDQVHPVVRPWIKSATLELTVGSSPIKVSLSGARGEVTGVLAVDGSEQAFAEASFEALMDETMLPRLNLRSLTKWQRYPKSEDGRAARHGWTALVPALFLPHHSSDSLLGNAPLEAGTLLQVFLGLPWYSTERQAALAISQLDQVGRDESRRAKRDEERDREQRLQIEADLKAVENEIAALPDPEAATSQLEAAAARLSAATRALIKLRAVSDERKLEAEGAATALREARSAVQVLRETAAAQAVFSELKATACPRCEVSIGDDRRKAEEQSNVCMVCGRQHDPADNVDNEAVIADAEQRVSELHEGADAARSRADDVAADLAAAEQEEADARYAHEVAQPGMKVLHALRAKEVQQARLQGKLEALERRTEQGPDAEPSLELAVLKAAQNEAKQRVDDSDLFNALSEDILAVAHRFGLTMIDKVTINRAARLPAMIDGVEVPFGQQQPSEKLRLRIATIIALLRVGERGGPARHPGLIVIDSPAAEEVADVNLAQMLAALVELSSSSEIQVLLATIRTDAVGEALPRDHIRFVPTGEKLW
jgi:hypothetical protein